MPGETASGRQRPRLSKSADFDRVYRKGRLGRQPAPGAVCVSAWGSDETADAAEAAEAAARRVGRSQGRRRGRAQPREAPAPRGFWSLPERSARAGTTSWSSRGPGPRRARGRRGTRRRCRATWPSCVGARSRAPGGPEPAGRVQERCATSRPARARSGSTSGSSRPLLPRRCKYEPTCSAYAVEAIRTLRARCAASCWPAGGCCAATPSATAGYDPVGAALFRGCVR